MRLSKPFYRLPVRFDVARLRAELAALPASAWARHPNAIPGNSSLRLVSVGGGENDDVDGEMRATPHLAQSPYLRQILASFGVIWSRSRLLKLAPGAEVPEHADINYHWFNRVRIHIPIETRPEVRFYCGDQGVHMAAGEAWVFDNWRLHRVINPTIYERVHLVADTSGSASFWRFVAQAEDEHAPTRELPYDPSANAQPLTERATLATVMAPAEVDLLTLDLRAELMVASGMGSGEGVARESAQVPGSEGVSRASSQLSGSDGVSRASAQLLQYHALLDAMCRDWRQLYALHGGDGVGLADFEQLRDHVRETSRALSKGLVMRTNGVGAHEVLEGRLLRPMLPERARRERAQREHSLDERSPRDQAPHDRTLHERSQPERIPHERSSYERSSHARSWAQIDRPLIIIAAPRSGSTLLFETLATSRSLYTLGGEGHELVEGLHELRPGITGLDSNRLTAEHATEDATRAIVDRVLSDARDSRGEAAPAHSPFRFLEKTPKNALRIPFLNRVFPDARFIVLWRDPRENLSSIMEAWRSGRWKTYNGLQGFDGPWSLLLPPGWQAMNRRPLEEIAAFQWNTTYRTVLDDLAALPRDRWTALGYAQFVASPETSTRALCAFAAIEFDASLAERVSRPLPPSRYTLTPPDSGKWRRNEAEIERVLPSVAETWHRLRALR